MANAIELNAVSKRYGRTLAVDRLSLAVEPGELFAFVGPNGAGKTTTIKLIVGLLCADEGDVHVCGHPMIQSDGLPAKRHLAYVPDEPYLYEKLSGREFLHFVARMYGMTNDERDASLGRLSERLQLGPFLDRLSEAYSHGMKQRVVIAAALLHHPRVLVIDEPMVGLDPRTAREVKDLFKEHTQNGGTVFMSTHTLEVAEAVADRIGIFHRGRLAALGTMRQLRDLSHQSASLEEVFLLLTEEVTDAPTG